VEQRRRARAVAIRAWAQHHLYFNQLLQVHARRHQRHLLLTQQVDAQGARTDTTLRKSLVSLDAMAVCFMARHGLGTRWIPGFAALYNSMSTDVVVMRDDAIPA
jgi:hypothetical protein